MIPNPFWPIRIVPTRWGRFVCLTCGLVVAGTIAALAHACRDCERSTSGSCWRHPVIWRRG